MPGLNESLGRVLDIEGVRAAALIDAGTGMLVGWAITAITAITANDTPGAPADRRRGPGQATGGRQLVSLRVSTPETGGGLLVVHAHPDDESIETGATMARYAAAGIPVTLVTCTLGELGEIIPADLAYLAAGRGDLLGKYRIGELEAACAALGVRDHRFLGGPGRWRDSGMMGLPSNDDPGCFWQADTGEAALDLVGIIREVRPRVMVSYDDRGFYGHPDHIQAHRVAWRAFQLASPGFPGGPRARGRWPSSTPRPCRARCWPRRPTCPAGTGWPLRMASSPSRPRTPCRSAPRTTR